MGNYEWNLRLEPDTWQAHSGWELYLRIIPIISTSACHGTQPWWGICGKGQGECWARRMFNYRGQSWYSIQEKLPSRRSVLSWDMNKTEEVEGSGTKLLQAKGWKRQTSELTRDRKWHSFSTYSPSSSSWPPTALPQTLWTAITCQNINLQLNLYYLSTTSTLPTGALHSSHSDCWSMAPAPQTTFFLISLLVTAQRQGPEFP